MASSCCPAFTGSDAWHVLPPVDPVTTSSCPSKDPITFRPRQAWPQVANLPNGAKTQLPQVQLEATCKQLGHDRLRQPSSTEHPSSYSRHLRRDNAHL